MGRPREFDPDVAMEQAMLAFWRRGYLGTGIQELVNTTGVNRASLYGAFGNKQKIFLAALARYTDICVSGLERELQSRPGAVAGLRAMLDRFLDGLLGNNRGCMLYNTALESVSMESKIRESVDEGLLRIETLVTNHIRGGQEKGEIDRKIDPLTASRVIMAAMQSMTVRSAAGGSREVLENIRDGAMQLLGDTNLN